MTLSHNWLPVEKESTMLNQAETDERVQVLAWLPPEKVAEVEGLVDFLRFQDDRHLVRAALVGPT